jgi:hypothetical protein
LKVNAAKSFFCTHEIEYLGYILTRGGIKPQPKKVQAILVINPPNTVKELRHFLGMVQYYLDMWAKRSEMLAPLSNLVGEFREAKIHQPLLIAAFFAGNSALHPPSPHVCWLLHPI